MHDDAGAPRSAMPSISFKPSGRTPSSVSWPTTTQRFRCLPYRRCLYVATEPKTSKSKTIVKTDPYEPHGSVQDIESWFLSCNKRGVDGSAVDMTLVANFHQKYQFPPKGLIYTLKESECHGRSIRHTTISNFQKMIVIGTHLAGFVYWRGRLWRRRIISSKDQKLPVQQNDSPRPFNSSHYRYKITK